MAIMAGKNSPEREAGLQGQIRELRETQKELRQSIAHESDRLKLWALEGEAIDVSFRLTELYFKTDSGMRELAANANRIESQAMRRQNIFIGPGPQPKDIFVGGDHDR